MKNYKIIFLFFIQLLLLVNFSVELYAQDTTVVVTKKVKPVKNTFESAVLMDNQTIMVPIKGTMEMTIQHRFGTIKNGSKDLFGLWAPSNIRIGMSYVPIRSLVVGMGITKERGQWDVNAKYALLQQTPGTIPLSVTYFADAVMDTRNKSNFRNSVDRFSYFNQLIIGRKITSRFSAQAAPSFSWFNNVEGYVDSKGVIQNKMQNYHFAVSVMGRYKITPKSSITAGYDQPLTQHPTNNPHPNIAFGFETSTGSHAFQVFAGTYYGIVPESNNMFNKNDYKKGQFVIGFNITRLWNF